MALGEFHHAENEREGVLFEELREPGNNTRDNKSEFS